MKIKFLVFLNIFVINCFGINRDEEFIRGKNIKHAIEQGSLKQIATLVDNTNVNSLIPGSKYTPITYALDFAASDKIEHILKYLIEQGANVNLEDENFYSPLEYAIRNKYINIDIIKLLLNNGANPNPKTLLAACRKSLDIVKLLFEYGARVLQRDKEGKSIFISHFYPYFSPEILALLAEKRTEEEQLIDEGKKKSEGKQPEEKKAS